MYPKRLYELGATKRRVRYAISTILRDRLTNEGAFRICFEMEDADVVIAAILKRGIENRRFRVALEKSHLVNLAVWLFARPEFAEAYYRLDSSEAQSEHRAESVLT